MSRTIPTIRLAILAALFVPACDPAEDAPEAAALAELAPDEQVPVYDDGQEMLYHGERILLAELDEHPPHVVTHDGALYGFDDRVEANRFLAEQLGHGDLAIAPDYSYADCPAGAACFYENPDFSGDTFGSTYTGYWPYLGNYWNDRISSVKNNMWTGYLVELHEHASRGGYTFPIYSGQWYSNLHSLPNNWGDRASSIDIYYCGCVN